MNQIAPEPSEEPVFPLINKVVAPVLQSPEALLGRECIYNSFAEAEKRYRELSQEYNPNKQDLSQCVEDLLYISYFQIYNLFQRWLAMIFQGTNQEIELKNLDEYRDLILPSGEFYKHSQFAIYTAKNYNHAYISPNLEPLLNRITTLINELSDFYQTLIFMRAYYTPFQFGALLRKYANFINDSGMDVNIFEEVKRLYGVLGSLNNSQWPPVRLFDDEMMTYYFLTDEGYFHGVAGTYVNFPRFDLIEYHLKNSFEFNDEDLNEFMTKLKGKFERLPTSKWGEICEINDYNILRMIEWLIENIDGSQMDPNDHILRM